MLCKLNEVVTHKIVNDSESAAQSAADRPATAPSTTNYQAQAESDQYGKFAPPGRYLAPSVQQTAPQTAYLPQTNVIPNGFPQQQMQMQMQQNAPLQGNASVVAAGTQYSARLETYLDSGSSKAGDRIEANITDPIISNGVEVVPAGSKLVGSITKVVCAKSFKFGQNGSIAFKFTTIETPDGRKIPLETSISDKSQVKTSGGSQQDESVADWLTQV